MINVPGTFALRGNKSDLKFKIANGLSNLSVTHNFGETCEQSSLFKVFLSLHICTVLHGTDVHSDSKMQSFIFRVSLNQNCLQNITFPPFQGVRVIFFEANALH